MTMPFRFLDDIAPADAAFEARGDTLGELFVAASEALLGTMMAVPGNIEPRQEIAIRLKDRDLDMLLCALLEELIYLKDARSLLLQAAKIRIDECTDGYSLEAIFKGEVIDSSRHPLLVDVKAVTLHRLEVIREKGQWKAVVVLDV